MSRHRRQHHRRARLAKARFLAHYAAALDFYAEERDRISRELEARWRAVYERIAATPILPGLLDAVESGKRHWWAPAAKGGELTQAVLTWKQIQFRDLESNQD